MNPSGSLAFCFGGLFIIDSITLLSILFVKNNYNYYFDKHNKSFFFFFNGMKLEKRNQTQNNAGGHSLLSIMN